MINWALRYQSIIRVLDELHPSRVLDVGSGAEGLRLFWAGPVVGVDLAFKRRPLHQAVQASGLALPFGRAAFPAVVSSDVLEHIPAELRRAALHEWLRVCQGHLLLTFPSGPAATQAYLWLAERLHPAPVWLQEHLQNGLPEAEEVASWLQEWGWQVRSTWLEDAPFHARLVRWEETALGKLTGYSLSRLCGPWLARHLVMPQGQPLRVFIHAFKKGL